LRKAETKTLTIGGKASQEGYVTLVAKKKMFVEERYVLMGTSYVKPVTWAGATPNGTYGTFEIGSDERRWKFK
jgi:hypothetical protein